MTQKITMGRDKRQDKIDAINAARIGQANPFIAGIQSVYAEGAGDAVKASRGAIGAPSTMPQDVLQGNSSNFSQPDAALNAPKPDPVNSTGSVPLGTSATRNANQDPEAFQTDALDRRLALYAAAGGNAAVGNNDRSRIGSLN